jgi:hypothetical protein
VDEVGGKEEEVADNDSARESVRLSRGGNSACLRSFGAQRSREKGWKGRPENAPASFCIPLLDHMVFFPFLNTSRLVYILSVVLRSPVQFLSLILLYPVLSGPL